MTFLDIVRVIGFVFVLLGAVACAAALGTTVSEIVTRRRNDNDPQA